jgi:NAD(P)-dependent dehydrogenase (short-subunit alcohol dehydrogenase family)
MSDQRLDGRVAVVTGAGSGLGRASAIALAAAGASVAVSDVDESGGVDTVATIEREGGTASFIPADVSRAGDCEALMAQATARHGRLDVLHANAGISGAGADTADLAPTALWDRVVAINLSGVYYCCHFALEHMTDGDGGSIIATASSMASLPLGLTDAYAASKAGVASLVKSMCVTAGARGVRVNAIGPGYVDTPMNAMIWDLPEIKAGFERGHATGLQTPEEIADVVVFLASDASRSLTGALITCDRGWTAFKSPDILRG